MRQWLNVVRAKRDEWRQSYSRWRFDTTRPPVERLEGIERVVFVRWDAKWGDSVIFSFMCRELKKVNASLSVEVISTPEMAALFRDQFGVDAVYEIRKWPGNSEIRRLARQIGKPDLAVHFSTLIKSRDMYLLHCLRARHTASLDDSVGLVDVKLGAATQGLHMEDKYCELLTRLGASSPDKHYIVPFSIDHEREVEVFLKGRARPYVAINPFSKGRAKTLKTATTLRLIDVLCERLPGHDVCLLTAPGWTREISAITAAWPEERCFLFPETSSIYHNVAILRHAAALVTGSTATVHIADGLGIPSLVLFVHSPDDLANWHSVAPGSINLMAKPSVPIDANALEWNAVDKGIETLCSRVEERAKSAV